MVLTTPLTVALDSIHPDFYWSLHQDVGFTLEQEFVDSIRRFGILHPPLVIRRTPEHHDIICGAKRILAAHQALESRDIFCLILEPSTPSSDILHLLVEEQKLSAPLSPIEKARFAVLSREHGGDVASDIISAGINLQHKGTITQLIRFLELEAPLRQALHNGSISEKIGLELLTLSSSDRLVLHKLFSHLSLNANKQRRIIAMSRIIAAREQCSLTELFSSRYAHYMRQPSIKNIPQATQHLLHEMDRHSRPMVVKAERRFNEQVAELNLPRNCSLSASPAFEQDKVTFHVDFPDLETFTALWQDLESLVTKDA